MLLIVALPVTMLRCCLELLLMQPLPLLNLKLLAACFDSTPVSLPVDDVRLKLACVGLSEVVVGCEHRFIVWMAMGWILGALPLASPWLALSSVIVVEESCTPFAF